MVEVERLLTGRWSTVDCCLFKFCAKVNLAVVDVEPCTTDKKPKMTTSDLLHIPDAMTAPTMWPPVEPLALPTKYDLDPFQKHAVLAMHAGDHVFVTAKTGSGKTFVGEYLIARMLAAGKRVFYTTPIKSLSNQKYHDLKKLFQSSVLDKVLAKCV